MQIPALTAIKASFVFFYRRIFNTGQNKLFQKSSVALLSLVVIWATGFFFSFLFICRVHPTAYWTTLLVEKEKCVNTVALHNTYGVSDVVLDIFIISFPVPWVSVGKIVRNDSTGGMLTALGYAIANGKKA